MTLTRDEFVLKNLLVIRELLQENETELRMRVKGVKDIRTRRAKRLFIFSRYSEFIKGLYETQLDLEKLLYTITDFKIEEGTERYHILYKRQEIETVEEYKCFVEEYTERINQVGLRENIVFSECKTLVGALIEALPLILVEEE